MNPITIVFASIKGYLLSENLLSRLREPNTAEAAVRPAVKGILESMVEIIDALEEGGFQKMTSKPVLVLSPGYTHPPDELKFVNAIIALIFDGKYD